MDTGTRHTWYNCPKLPTKNNFGVHWEIQIFFCIHENCFHDVVYNVFWSVLKVLGHTVVIASMGVCTLDVLFFVSFVNKKI